MKNQVIIAAGGLGTRLGNSRIKPLVLLNKKPLLIYCLEVFDKLPLIHSIIVVASQENLSEFEHIIKKHKIAKVVKTIAGGKTRRDSVKKGLKVLDSDTHCVVVHDGVRPFVDADLIKEAISLIKEEKAIVTAVPVKPTIKEIDPSQMVVRNTLDRNTLWEIQTPQVFLKDTILMAHEKNEDAEATDDAVLVERLGIKVKVLKGSYRNIKITTEDDLILAQAFLAKVRK